MGKQKEGSLQERIQKLIERRGGYCKKNWGNMTSEPGVADITACYKGLYLAIEVKEGNNTPSPQQGIHARNVWKAGGVCIVVWDVKTVETVLIHIDSLLLYDYSIDYINFNLKTIFLPINKIDDGTRW